MKSSQITLLILAFALGAGVMAAINLGGGDEGDLERRLAAAEERNKTLEAQVSSAQPPAEPEPAPEPKPTLSALPAPAGEGDADDGAEESPEERIAKLFNSPEARSLMKGFAGAMSGRADQWIGREIGKYKEKLGLTDAQAASIKGRMLAMVEENTRKFQSDLDDNSRPMQEIMEAQGQFWRQNEDAIEAMLKEELTDDQFVQFERQQLEEKTKSVQWQADRELRRIDDALELSEAQEDQVFNILVRESPDYDPAMAIEGADTALPAAATAEDVTKEDAIRSVLTPDQTETYNSRLEDGGFGRRRGPWGGGFGRPR